MTTTHAIYWGRQYDVNEDPFPTHIRVEVKPREGRDGVADATWVIQTLINYIEASFKAALISDTPPPPPQTKEAHERLDSAAFDCVDAWLNTTATPEHLEEGINDGMITLDPTTNQYIADRTENEYLNYKFYRWASDVEGIPWVEIVLDTDYGAGCRYATASQATPPDPVREQTATDCLNLWLSRVHNGEELINQGLSLGTLTPDPTTGQYHPQPASENMRDWIQDNDIPWVEIRSEVIYGSGQCGYPQ